MEENSSSEVCVICDKKFSSKGGVYRHIRNVHRATVIIRGKLKCPLCDVNPQDYMTLRRHIFRSHGHKMEREILTFPSLDAFNEWKAILEQQTNYRYVRRTGLKQTPQTSIRKDKIHFMCHRSGFYKPKADGQKKPKSQGSNKINSNCPSTIEATVDSFGSVNVVFWKSHVGHDIDIEHVPLTAEERAFLADKILKGMTFEEILKEIQSVDLADNSRLSFVTRRDLHNIKRTCSKLNSGAYSFQNVECVFAESDQESVVKRMKDKIEQISKLASSIVDEDVSEISEHLDKAIEKLTKIVSQSKNSSPQMSATNSNNPPALQISSVCSLRNVKEQNETHLNVLSNFNPSGILMPQIHTGADHTYV